MSKCILRLTILRAVFLIMDDLMPIRFTNSGKWADKWFRNLSPYAKTLYWYLWDVCDIAGFWEIDFDHAAYHTKIPEDEIQGAFKGLCRGYIEVDGYIWIRRFLYHQRNLPLNNFTQCIFRKSVNKLHVFRQLKLSQA